MVKGFLPIVIITDGSRSSIAAKSLQFFPVLSESEMSNSMVMGVVYRLLTNLTSAACAIRRLRLRRSKSRRDTLYRFVPIWH